MQTTCTSHQEMKLFHLHKRIDDTFIGFDKVIAKIHLLHPMQLLHIHVQALKTNSQLRFAIVIRYYLLILLPPHQSSTSLVSSYKDIGS